MACHAHAYQRHQAQVILLIDFQFPQALVHFESLVDLGDFVLAAAEGYGATVLGTGLLRNHVDVDRKVAEQFKEFSNPVAVCGQPFEGINHDIVGNRQSGYRRFLYD